MKPEKPSLDQRKINFPLVVNILTLVLLVTLTVTSFTTYRVQNQLTKAVSDLTSAVNLNNQLTADTSDSESTSYLQPFEAIQTPDWTGRDVLGKPTPGTPTPTGTPPPVVVATHNIEGYYISWGTYARAYEVTDIPADKLTHVYYAFSNTDTTSCVLGDEFADINKSFDGDSTAATAPRGNFNQLKKLKAKYPHLKIVMAIGGWSFSNYFSDLALTDASRQAFVQSCINMYINGNYSRTATTPATPISMPGIFDGLNVDWEYPVADGEAGNVERPEDKQNFTKLLAEFRRQLDIKGTADGKSYILSTDIVGDPGKYDEYYEIANIHQYLNIIHAMTIEYNGQFSVTPRTGFQSPIYGDTANPDQNQGTYSNIDQAVIGLQQRGVPTNKIIVGTPWYGKLYSQVPNVNNGLYQVWAGAPRGTWGAGGNMDYWDIKKNYLASTRYTKYYNTNAKAEWLFNGSSFVDYSGGTRAAQEKTDYVKAKGLPGVWIWELSMDDKVTDDLINITYNALK
jgi:chitinase